MHNTLFIFFFVQLTVTNKENYHLHKYRNRSRKLSCLKKFESKKAQSWGIFPLQNGWRHWNMTCNTLPKQDTPFLKYCVFWILLHSTQTTMQSPSWACAHVPRVTLGAVFLLPVGRCLWCISGYQLLEAVRWGRDDDVKALMANGAPFTTDWCVNYGIIIGLIHDDTSVNHCRETETVGS